MKRNSIYEISSLPALGELGSGPPFGPAQLLERLADNPGALALAETLFLFADLLEREAFLAGEIEDVAPVVLSRAQACNEAPLPAYLAGGEAAAAGTVSVDRLWEACFRHAREVARRHGSVFLADWVGYEVALRNAVAAARARKLGLDEGDYLVATDLARGDEEELGRVVDAWAAASTPLAGLRVLTEARWAWLAEHDAWFSFRDDELAAYAARLMLLSQWLRLAQADEKGPAGGQARASSESLERTTR